MHLSTLEIEINTVAVFVREGVKASASRDGLLGHGFWGVGSSRRPGECPAPQTKRERGGRKKNIEGR